LFKVLLIFALDMRGNCLISHASSMRGLGAQLSGARLRLTGTEWVRVLPHGWHLLQLHRCR